MRYLSGEGSGTHKTQALSYRLGATRGGCGGSGGGEVEAGLADVPVAATAPAHHRRIKEMINPA